MRLPRLILTIGFVSTCLLIAFQHVQKVNLEASVEKLRNQVEEVVLRENNGSLKIKAQNANFKEYIDGLTNRVGQLQAELEQTKAKLNSTQNQLEDAWIELKRWKDAWKKLPGE